MGLSECIARFWRRAFIESPHDFLQEVQRSNDVTDVQFTLRRVRTRQSIIPTMFYRAEYAAYHGNKELFSISRLTDYSEAVDGWRQVEGEIPENFYELMIGGLVNEARGICAAVQRRGIPAMIVDNVAGQTIPFKPQPESQPEPQQTPVYSAGKKA